MSFTGLNFVFLVRQSDSAVCYRNPIVFYFHRNHQKLRDILNLHLVRERLPLDAIIHNNMNQVNIEMLIYILLFSFEHLIYERI